MEWNDKWKCMIRISGSLIIMGEHQRFVTEELTEDLTEDIFFCFHIVCAAVVPFFSFLIRYCFFFDWYYTMMV